MCLHQEIRAYVSELETVTPGVFADKVYACKDRSDSAFPSAAEKSDTWLDKRTEVNPLKIG